MINVIGNHVYGDSLRAVAKARHVLVPIAAGQADMGK